MCTYNATWTRPITKVLLEYFTYSVWLWYLNCGILSCLCTTAKLTVHWSCSLVLFSGPVLWSCSLVTGHWSLVTGHWSLVIGHWSLVTSHWSLVTGHWSLVTGHLSSYVSLRRSKTAAPCYIRRALQENSGSSCCFQTSWHQERRLHCRLAIIRVCENCPNNSFWL